MRSFILFAENTLSRRLTGFITDFCMLSHLPQYLFFASSEEISYFFCLKRTVCHILLCTKSGYGKVLCVIRSPWLLWVMFLFQTNNRLRKYWWMFTLFFSSSPRWIRHKTYQRLKVLLVSCIWKNCVATTFFIGAIVWDLSSMPESGISRLAPNRGCRADAQRGNDI